MQLDVYVDVLFLLNTLMDYIILYIVYRIRKQGTSCKRMMFGAMIGSLITCIITLTELPGILDFIIIYVVTGLLVVRVVFGKQGKRTLVLNYIYLLFITFILGGAISSIYSYTRAGYIFQSFIKNVLTSTSKLYGIIMIVLIVLPVGFLLYSKSKKAQFDETHIFQIKMKVEEDIFACSAFLDTGNSLKDPVFGIPVILVEKNLLSNIYDDIKEKRPELIRVIPYRCVGNPDGILMGIKLKELRIMNGEEEIVNKTVIAALSEVVLDGQGRYQALLQKSLFYN